MDAMRVETIGDCTLYLGDCRDILPTLPKVDAVITDPPYGLAGILHRPGNGAWEKHFGEGAPKWDATTAEDVVLSLPSIGKVCVIWGGNYYALPPARGWLLWDKIVRNFSSGHAEMAWTTIAQPVRTFSYSHGQLANECKQHPTQKPVPLMAWCIHQTGKPSIVLDPFMGSGSTGVACVHFGIKFIGIEIDPNYFEIACDRISRAVAQGRLFDADSHKPEQVSLL